MPPSNSLTSSSSSSSSRPFHLSLSPLSTPPQPTSLPTPPSTIQNRSFANLARFFGIGSTTSFPTDDVPTETTDPEVEEDETDEESLMWQAQTALVSHHPQIAIQAYTTAALPPHRSPSACLALGNLLTRGTAFAEPRSTLNPLEDIKSKRKADTNDNRLRRMISFFYPPLPSPTLVTPPLSPPPERRFDLATNGWTIPKEGKRAVRDAKGMGIAGGWLVLGIGWVVDGELDKEAVVNASLTRIDIISGTSEDEDGVMVFDVKSKGRARGGTEFVSRIQHSGDTKRTIRSSESANTLGSSNTSMTETETSKTEDSTRVADDLDPRRRSTLGSEFERLNLLYDLLVPLLHLYRNGHIQAHDPVALPPISPSQLPLVLQPQGDLEKGRNVWHLGNVVATRLMQLRIMTPRSSIVKDRIEQRRNGVTIMATYLQAMTSPPSLAEPLFRSVVSFGTCGLTLPDQLVHQAAKRLDIILRSPLPSPSMSLLRNTSDGYPFPPLQSIPTRTHKKTTSTLSNISMMSKGKKNKFDLRHRIPSTTSMLSLSSNYLTPVKSSASLVSLSTVDVDWTPSRGVITSADSLRKIQQNQQDQLAPFSPPTPKNDSFLKPSHSQQTLALPLPSQSSYHPQPISYESKRIVKTPVQDRTEISQNQSEHQIQGTDPVLAAAELRSALTKHVLCSVCGSRGVNLPECRKCGLVFCSRACRVDIDKAGDGKRHVCGVWERKRFLSVPSVGRRGSRLQNVVVSVC
ncbi:hypothetical protein M231_05364 [Tremella mesenterica]|uniref:Uncharacterized protein n=1 Tax=Tremella mesenterica TaxID=5217 RepID=A0A4V1M3M4_TREME|nr:hypothetical protein M231_05364 [Tremella mesenterica]